MALSDNKDYDFPQVLKESFDPDEKRLRVDAIINDGVDALIINPDGSINADVIVENAIVNVPYDSIYASYPTAVQEVYTYQNAAVTVAVVTVDYTDSTKNFILSVVRTP
jgi:hypothetical protein